MSSLLVPREKLLIVLFLALKLTLLILFPLTGDEAYFITWGQDVSLGYYDHPPAVGWVIFILNYVSENYYFYRAFAFFTSFVVALLIYKLMVTHKGHETAVLVSLVFFVSPISLILVILTNDVVLLLFGFTGFYFFTRSLSKGLMVLALISGVFLGLSFLSKYFSVLLLIGLVLYLLFNRNRRNGKIILAGLLVVAIFVFENVYFNFNNCWNNILFNLFSRTTPSKLNIANVGLFFLSLLIVVPPYGIYLLSKIKHRQQPEVLKQAIYVAVTFIACFFLLSFTKRIGLHWFSLSLPFIYMLFSNFPADKLRNLLKYNALFSIILALGLVTIITGYDSFFASHKKYADLLFYMDTKSVCDQLPEKETVYTLGYSMNSVLSYYCTSNEFHVISNTSKYGREDDKKINYSYLDGKSLQVFVLKENDISKIDNYFESLDVSPIRANSKIDYYLVKGHSFKYEKYRNEVISIIDKRYYSAPDYFPNGQCNFKRKYSL